MMLINSRFNGLLSSYHVCQRTANNRFEIVPLDDCAFVCALCACATTGDVMYL